MLTFFGVAGLRENISAWLQWVDMLSAPGWVNVTLIVLGVAGLAYGFWPRGEVDKAMDRELSEEGLVKLAELKLQRQKELLAFISKNAMYLYLILTFSILWILKPLLDL